MISVVILTRNEEKLIRACLESVKWADEIIIVDHHSTDKTLEIVKKYTSKIYSEKSDDYSVRRNIGMEKATGEWVLYVDADERVLEKLKEELIRISQNNSAHSAYAIARRNIIFGKEVQYGPYSDDYMIRYFKKADFETWIGKVHEYGKFKGSLGYTHNFLLHLTHRDIDHVVLKSLRWSKIDAKLRLEANHPKMTSWRFFRILCTETIEQGIIRRGFFNGTVGVIDSLLQVFSLFISYVRLWQYQQSKPLDKIYQDLDKQLIENQFKWQNRSK